MATVNKNFRIKNGLVVEGSTATVNGQNILTETGSDQYILDLVGGENLIDSVASGLSVDGSAQLSIDRTVVDTWYDANGAAATAQSNAEDYADGLASNYDAAGAAATAQSNAEDYADGLASNYDPSGSAATAQSNAEDYADGLAANYDAAGAAATAQSNAEDYADGLASNYDAAGAAATAQSNAEDYADGLASNYDAAGAASTAQSNAEDYADGLASNYDAAGAASTAETNAKNYADDLIGDATVDGTSGNTVTARIASAVSGLVGTAPAVLDTLGELATALEENPDIISDLRDIASGKQGTLTASTGITIDGSNNISVTANTYDAYGAASTAQSNAEDYADGLASNYDPAGSAATAQSNAEDYADGLTDDILDGTSAFTAINVNSVAKQVAATTGNIVTAAATTAYSWAALDFRSAKFIVKAKYGAHTQVSDLVVTLDTSNNVAVSEYGITYSNGTELAAVTADYSGTDVRIRVTPANNNTEVVVVGTLIK